MLTITHDVYVGEAGQDQVFEDFAADSTGTDDQDTGAPDAGAQVGVA